MISMGKYAYCSVDELIGNLMYPLTINLREHPSVICLVWEIKLSDMTRSANCQRQIASVSSTWSRSHKIVVKYACPKMTTILLQIINKIWNWSDINTIQYNDGCHGRFHLDVLGRSLMKTSPYLILNLLVKCIANWRRRD